MYIDLLVYQRKLI